MQRPYLQNRRSIRRSRVFVPALDAPSGGRLEPRNLAALVFFPLNGGVGPWGLMGNDGTTANPNIDGQAQQNTNGFAEITGSSSAQEKLTDGSGADNGGVATQNTQFTDFVQAPGGTGGSPSFSAGGSADEVISETLNQNPENGLIDQGNNVGAFATAQTVDNPGGGATHGPALMTIGTTGRSGPPGRGPDIQVNFDIHVFLSSTGAQSAVGNKSLYLATGEILVMLNTAPPGGGAIVNGLQIWELGGSTPGPVFHDANGNPAPLVYGFNVANPNFTFNPPDPGNVSFTVPSAGVTSDFVDIAADTTTVTYQGTVPVAGTSTALYTSSWNLSEAFVA